MAENYSSFRKEIIEHFRQHPEEVAAYLQVALEESKEDGNWAAFMIALRTAVEAKGTISDLAKNLGRSRTTLYKTLSEDSTPQLASIEAILHEVGCELSIRPLATP